MIRPTETLSPQRSQLPALSSQLAAATFTVEHHLSFWWSAELAEHRKDITDMLGWLREIHAAPSRNAKAKAIARIYPHLSAKTLMRKYRLYVNGGYRSDIRRPENYHPPGDWRCLLDAWAVREGKHPQKFIDYLALLCLSNQRKTAPALRQLYREWQAGKDIPGYGTWQQLFVKRFSRTPGPKCPPDFFPDSWSDSTLRRLCPADDMLALGRQGLAAAEDYFAQISFNPCTLRAFEVVFIDDWFANFKVQHGQQIDYAMGLAALDWGSRTWLHWRLAPRAVMADGTRRALTDEDMAGFITELLALTGLPEGYAIILVVENHTASVSTEFEARLKQTFGDRVIIRRSGLLNSGSRVLQHGFAERGGKWRTKAPIESGFNLLKNECASLPGQRGSKERTNAPGDLAEREKWAVKVLEDDDLPAEFKSLVDRVFLPMAEAELRVDEIFCRINEREWHRLKGFRRLHFWRLCESQEWIPSETPPTEEQRAQIERGVRILTTDRPETPKERLRWLMSRETWVRIPASALVPLGARCEKVKVTKKGEIVIDRRHLPEPWRFYSRDTRFAGLLVPGTEYRAFFLEDDPDAIHLTTLDSIEVLGSVPRFRDVDPMDEEAKTAAYAHTGGVKANTLAELRRIMAPVDAEFAMVKSTIAEAQAAARAGVAMVNGAAVVKAAQRKETAATRARNATRSSQLAARARERIESQ